MVTDYYQKLLGRASRPAPSEMAGWVQAKQDIFTLPGAFCASREFYRANS